MTVFFLLCVPGRGNGASQSFCNVKTNKASENALFGTKKARVHGL